MVCNRRLPKSCVRERLPCASFYEALESRIPDAFLESRALPDANLHVLIDQIHKGFHECERLDKDVTVDLDRGNGMGVCAGALAVKINRKASFSLVNVREALENPDATWFHSSLLAQAKKGCLPICEAFRAQARARAQGKETQASIISDTASCIYEEISLEWQFMVQRGLTWGIVTSGLVSVIIRNSLGSPTQTATWPTLLSSSRVASHFQPTMGNTRQALPRFASFLSS